MRVRKEVGNELMHDRDDLFTRGAEQGDPLTAHGIHLEYDD